MARCPLCESDVPDGRTACDVCGQPFDRAPTARAAPDVVRKAIDAARKDLVASSPSSVDASFARRLTERAEQTEAAGDLGKALDLARASRRTLEIAKRKARVVDVLARSDTILEEARQAGIETLAFQRNIEQAKALTARGDFVTAEKLLRRVSTRTLDQRRERILQADARKALALRDYGKIRSLCAKAIEKAEQQRKYARAEDVLDRAAADVDAARKDGVNITEARKVLTQARDALRRGVFADIPLLEQRARNSLREARRYAAADVSQREAARERRKGADLGHAEAIFGQASTALASKDYSKVRALARDAHEAVREAALLKSVQDAFASLRLDAEDLRKLGAEASEFETTLVDVTRALEDHDLPNARRLVVRARRTAESARDAHHRSIMERSLQIILANAARGLDPALARQLLREVDDAISLGRQIDMQAIIDNRMADADAQTEARLNEHVLRARDDIVGLRQAGQNDTVSLEGKLADVAIAVQEHRFLQADAQLDGIEHDIHATRELLRSAAAEVLGEARGVVTLAKADGVPIDSAARMLQDAETAYTEARYGDTLYVGKACISEVEELKRTAHDSKRKTEEEDVRTKQERTEAIHRRMEAVRAEITDLVANHVDLDKAMEVLAAAEQAIERGKLGEAEHMVASAEGIVHGVKITLQRQAREAYERAPSGDLTQILSTMETAVNDARPAAVLEAFAELERRVAERRRERYQEEQRRTLEKARGAATKFIMVKKLIEDLRKADIDIAGAEEGLRAAERALEKRNFDDVESILTSLDRTAKELMDELVAASRNLINRAERKIHDGHEAGMSLGEAVSLLDKAEGHFERGEYADAVEHARAAEQKVADGLHAQSDAKAEGLRNAQEAARAELVAIGRRSWTWPER